MSGAQNSYIMWQCNLTKFVEGCILGFYDGSNCPEYGRWQYPQNTSEA